MAKLLPFVREIFDTLDKDNSGNVTLEEFVEADETVQEALEKVCQTDDLIELFEMLDVDGSGSVEIDEFSEQLASFGTIDQPFINIRLMKQLELARKELKNNRDNNTQRFSQVDSKLNKLGEEMVAIKAMLSDLGRAAGLPQLGIPVGAIAEVGEKRSPMAPAVSAAAS